jgi:hypothetical protein
MNKSTKPFRSFRFWLLLCVSVVLFFIAFGFIYVRVIDPPERIEITFTTNGMARVCGIPVSDQRIRRCVFWLASIVRSKDTQIVIQSRAGPGVHQAVLLTNELAVMVDLSRAGLTNR